ncbi:hypothetical protein Fmac_001835 [Flemingia macrophylla]|uniref:Glycine-rich protein n=1 Tax=Flemingia macrophylla TaxID=520843 RepID=A0ABD1NI79_9FABA
MASVLLLSADVAPKDAPKDIDKEFDNNDVEGDHLDTNGMDEMKYYRGWRRGYYGGWGRRDYGGWRRGWRGGYYCPYGCCGWDYYGRCWRCCYYPGQHVDAHTRVELMSPLHDLTLWSAPLIRGGDIRILRYLKVPIRPQITKKKNKEKSLKLSNQGKEEENGFQGFARSSCALLLADVALEDLLKDVVDKEFDKNDVAKTASIYTSGSYQWLGFCQHNLTLMVEGLDYQGEITLRRGTGFINSSVGNYNAKIR